MKKRIAKYHRDISPYSIFLGLFIGLLTVNIVVGLVNSFHWPIGHDAQIFYYVGAKILEGQMPYKDIFMMDMPVVYLINSLGIFLFGIFGDDVGQRLTDIGWLVFTGVMMYHFCKIESRMAGVAAALFFASYHMALGPDMAMQRDYLMAPFLVGSCHFFANYLEAKKPQKSIFIAGVFLALAAMIKPHPILLGVMFVIVLLSEKKPLKTNVVLKEIGLFCAGFGSVLLVLALWLLIGGAAGSLWEMAFEYIPVYNRFGTKPFLMNDIDKVLLFVGLTAVIANISQEKIRKRNTVLLCGCLYGFMHFHLQHFGMVHRLYPMRVFFILFLFFNLYGLFKARGLFPQIAAVCVLLWGLYIFSAFEMTKAEKINRHWEYQARQERINDIKMAFLNAAPDPLKPEEGNTMHFFDVITGFWYAALDVHSVSPSRCFSPYIFYMFPESPYVQSLQRRCIQQLESNLPKVIALGAFSFPRQEPFLIYRSQIFKDFLDQHYAPVVMKHNHRVFARKPPRV